jgi:hypothetical protein
LGHGPQGGAQIGLDGLNHLAEHVGGGVPVVRPDGGRVDLAPAAGAVAHQLVNDPSGDATDL